MSNRNHHPGKTWGAGIRCTVCAASPWPDDPATRESFDLRRYGPNGAPAASPAPGSWFCERHVPPRRDIPRAAGVTPFEALAEFERLFSAQGARLKAALRGHDDDDSQVAFEAYRELERGLASLKTAVALPEPPGGEGKATRQKPISKGKPSEQQGDWLDKKEVAETPP
jgi:hypothetical protein